MFPAFLSPGSIFQHQYHPAVASTVNNHLPCDRDTRIQVVELGGAESDLLVLLPVGGLDLELHQLLLYPLHGFTLHLHSPEREGRHRRTGGMIRYRKKYRRQDRREQEAGGVVPSETDGVFTSIIVFIF